MSILCIANQKGGVGKTTTAVNLAAGLARRGHKTLLLDLDIQGSATATLGVKLKEGDASVAECLIHERQIEHVVRETKTENLFVAPAGETLAAVDIHLATAMAREQVLQRCLSTVTDKVDYIVVDTAPYLGLLTYNALVAAEHILVPVSCEYLPILGLKLFGETLARIRQRLGARCEVLGYLLTMYDKRERITVEVEKVLRRQFGDAIFEHPIRVNTRHKAAPSHRKTIYEFEGSTGRGRADFEKLIDGVLARLDERARSGERLPQVVDQIPSVLDSHR
ncbi:MAG TPA: AAA family ATPase [Polyangia bacterium]|jgi:chromosome partitioning protein|nr:AAA family ATPase [Polyangia bacterium]HWE30101.1 AAA family ATPase [Polyangia bacterium]